MANGNSLGIGQEKNMPWWLAVARMPRATGSATRPQMSLGVLIAAQQGQAPR